MKQLNEKTAKVNGVEVEIIEMVGDFLIVQEVVSHQVYTLMIEQLDSCEPVAYNEPTSNIVSLKEWSKWQKRTRTKATTAAEPSKRPRRSPLLRVL